jgi:predicted nucleic acid-binding protein
MCYRRDREPGYEWLATHDRNWRRAHDVQAALWRGRHIRAVGLPDLLIGAVAERERVTILHHDGDDDPIAHVKARCASMADMIRHSAEPDGRVIFDHWHNAP